MTKNKVVTVGHDERYMLVIQEHTVENERDFTKLVKETVAIGDHRLFEVTDSGLELDFDTAFIDFHLNEEGLLANAIPTVAIMSNGQLTQVHVGSLVVSKFNPANGSFGHLSDEDLKLFYTKYERAILPKQQTALISAKHQEVYGGPEAEWAGKPVEVLVFIRN